MENKKNLIFYRNETDAYRATGVNFDYNYLMFCLKSLGYNQVNLGIEGNLVCDQRSLNEVLSRCQESTIKVELLFPGERPKQKPKPRGFNGNLRSSPNQNPNNIGFGNFNPQPQIKKNGFDQSTFEQNVQEIVNNAENSFKKNLNVMLSGFKFKEMSKIIDGFKINNINLRK